MKQKNPFSDYGGIVAQGRFVGRKSELKQVEKRLLGESFGNLAIIGLPRIGKSSLAWNSFITNKESLIQRKIFPVWIPLGEFLNLNELFDEILSSVCEIIKTTDLDLYTELNVIRKNFLGGNTNLEKRRFVKKFLRCANTNGIRLIIVFDEFDNAKDIFNLQDFQFLREISYNLETKIGIVTVSRNTIQELEPDNGSLSNFYQIFDELRLKLFSQEDIGNYWERLRNLGIDVSSHYTESVAYYSGMHPYLLDLINYSIFNSIEQNEISLDDIFTSTLDNLKLKIFNEYESILKLMRYEGLDNKLIQILVGPVYDISQRDVEKLVKYSLVNSNSLNEFECFAKYFQDYLSIKSAEIDIWPLWSETEIALRCIVKKFLLDKYGCDWVDKFVAGNPKKTGPIDKLKVAMSKNIKAFGDKASSNLVDYTYPAELFDCFMSTDWKWFKVVLGKEMFEWKPKFELLSEVRNPLAHNNRGFLPQSKLNGATACCQEILGLIQKWEKSKEN